jgi:uncharacterized protein involved in exopolysaccharide biosynthesis
MEENYVEKDFSDYLRSLFDFLKHNFFPIASITIISAIFSVWFALSITNEYRSTATLIPSSLNEDSDSGGLSALGEIAGLNMQGNYLASNLIAKELFKSKAFIYKFFDENNLLVTLMASKGWNQELDELIIDEKIYRDGKWQRPAKGLIKAKPSAEEVQMRFASKFSYLQERDKVITVSFTSYSPGVAQEVLTLLIQAVNDEVRFRDVSEAISSRDYLIEQFDATKQINVQTLIANLIEDEIKDIKLAEVKKDYVYTVVDTPSNPISRYGVPRSLICFLITLSGFFLSLVFVIFKDLYKR